MKGLIIYKKNEASVDYIEWLLNEFKINGINLELLYYEDFLEKGYKEKIDFVINKTRDVNISYIFELNNIKVINNSLITELSANKLKAYAHAKNNGLKTADVLLNNNNEKFIRKKIDGHGGEDITLTDVGFIDEENYLCQKYLGDTVGDIRFFVIGNKIVNACIRKNEKHFLHNFKKGANVSIYNVDDIATRKVNSFLNGIYCDFVGIDFLLQKDGELIFNEIEDVCGSRMLSFLGCNNTTNEYIIHIKYLLTNC